MTEKWRVITGFEDYEISELGHIRSKTHNSRMIHPYLTKYGIFVDLQAGNGTRRTIGLNALMMQEFGTLPKKPKEVPRDKPKEMPAKKLDESSCEAWL